MKTELTDTQIKFKPFAFKVEIENQREAEIFWALFNSSLDNLTDFLNKSVQKSSISYFSSNEKEVMGMQGGEIIEYIDKILQVKLNYQL